VSRILPKSGCPGFSQKVGVQDSRIPSFPFRIPPRLHRGCCYVYDEMA
jgi:hypothetical protein